VIRVLIVDDHAVVRAGLRRLLDAEPDIETVGEAPNADRAVFEALESRPDVVLMDLVMPGKSGIEGMPAVLQAVPEARVLVLSMQDDPRYVRAAFEAGTSSRRRLTPRSCPRSGPSQEASGTSTRHSARSSSRPT
jgi:two-component system response regulator NreC